MVTLASLLLHPPSPSNAAPEAQNLTEQQREQLKLGTALRKIGWISFYAQLVLSTVSGVILLFSSGITSSGALSVNPLDACTLVGVAGGLITSFLSWGWIRAGRRLAFLQDVKLQTVLATILAGTNLNLASMGATIIGLQATVGSLVGKTLSAAAGGYYGPRAPPPVAFDVFSVQACANVIMAHFVGLVLANWLLRVVQRHMAKEEELAFAPSAPPMPGY